MIKLSVILIGWNAWKDLQQCLPSLVDACAGVAHEIIYVDNGSEDGTTGYIRQQYPQVNLLENKKNAGVSKARNQGISLASGQYIWLLDSDTIVNPDALEALLNYIETHPDTGICACKLKDMNGTVQHSCRKFPTISYKLKSALHSIFRKINIPVYRKEMDAYAYNINGKQPVEVDYVIGACQLIKREVFDTTGLLDEKIFYGPEDADFCLRAKLSEWKTIYLPAISIIHQYQRVSTRKFFNQLTFYHIQSLFYYFRKHKNYGLFSKQHTTTPRAGA